MTDQPASDKTTDDEEYFDARYEFGGAPPPMKINRGKDQSTDYAEPWRRDLMLFPAGVIISAARRHLVQLKALERDVPDRDKAISDMTAFIRENQRV